MTLAVVADDAAGNRAAAFRDLNYTAAADLPEVIVALTAESDGSHLGPHGCCRRRIGGLDGIARQHQAHLFRRSHRVGR